MLGWEVYTGVQFLLDKYQSLNAQLRDCVRGKGSKEWHGISGTSKSAFKIDQLLTVNSSAVSTVCVQGI